MQITVAARRRYYTLKFRIGLKKRTPSHPKDTIFIADPTRLIEKKKKSTKQLCLFANHIIRVSDVYIKIARR